MTSGWLSLLPALVAIPIALITGRVLLALSLYVALGSLIAADFWLPEAFLRLLRTVWQVVADRDHLLIITFSLLIGGVIRLIERAGGIEGFALWAERRCLAGEDPNRPALLAWVISMVLFVESSFGALVAGLSTRPLFDRYRISRLKLSYILDATCAPKCMLIALNAWGAYVVTLLASQKVEAPIETLIASLGLLFYSWGAILLAAFIAATGFELIPAPPTAPLPTSPLPRRFGHPRWFFWPIGGLVFATVSLLLVLRDAPLAITVAVTGALLATASTLHQRAILTEREIWRAIVQGVHELVPLVYLVLLAFAIEATTRALGTGPFLAQLLQGEISPFWLPALVFFIGALISFSSGSSWGTFAILIPIVVPLAEAFEVPLPLLVGAALSGGLFGDHCSPVSDTTMVASLAAGVEPIDHIRHQLPYALLVAAITAVLYLAIGVIWL